MNSQKNKSKLVSVVIPFYSEVDWLELALDSVQKQTYENLEIILVNDGSVYDLSDLKNRFKNLKIINKKNGGAGSARNVGINNSNGYFIAFLDSDDLWQPSKIEQQVKYMLDNKLVWSQHSYIKFWEDKGREVVVDTSTLFDDVYINCFVSFPVQTSTIMVQAKIVKNEDIRFDEDFRYGQDGEFYKELAVKYQLGFVPDTFTLFRMRGSNVGFNPIIQVENKTQVWNKIKNNNELINTLPCTAVLAYKTCYRLDLLLKKISISKNKYIYGAAYVLPYCLFKISRKFISK